MFFFKNSIFRKVSLYIFFVCLFLVLFFFRDFFSNYFDNRLKKINTFLERVDLNNALVKKNEKLLEEIIAKKTLFDNLTSLKKENEKLKKLLEVKKKKVFEKKFIYANIISLSPNNYFHSFRIDKGKKENIKKGSLVIVYQNKVSLVGNVEKVFQHSSIVNTIYHPQFELPVVVGQQEIIGILKSFSFKSNFDLEIKYIKKEMDIETNMNVYTLGKSDEIPSGIYIGEISEVIKESYLFFQKIKVNSKTIDVFNVKEVFVIQ